MMMIGVRFGEPFRQNSQIDSSSQHHANVVIIEGNKELWNGLQVWSVLRG